MHFWLGQGKLKESKIRAIDVVISGSRSPINACLGSKPTKIYQYHKNASDSS